VGKLLSLSKIPFTKLDNLKPLRKKITWNKTTGTIVETSERNLRREINGKNHFI